MFDIEYLSEIFEEPDESEIYIDADYIDDTLNYVAPFFYGSMINDCFIDTRIDETKTYVLCPECTELHIIDIDIIDQYKERNYCCPSCNHESALIDYRDKDAECIIPLYGLIKETRNERGVCFHLYDVYLNYEARDYENYLTLEAYPDLYIREAGKEYWCDGKFYYFINQESVAGLDAVYEKVSHFEDSDYEFKDYENINNRIDCDIRSSDIKYNRYKNIQEPLIECLYKHINFLTYKVLYKNGFISICEELKYIDTNIAIFNEVKISKILALDVNIIKAHYNIEKFDIFKLIACREMASEGLGLYIKEPKNVDIYQGLSSIRDVLSVDLEKIFKYLRNQQGKIKNFNMTFYTDYIKFCKSLNYDISNKVINRPVNLKIAHDRVSAIISNQKNKGKAHDFSNVVNSYRKIYEYFEDDKYAVIAPQTPSAVVKEGRELNHCVGGYINRIISGNSIILFIREKKDIYKRLVTLEWNPQLNKKVQNYGLDDELPSAEVLDFIARWEKVVIQRIKRSA